MDLSQYLFIDQHAHPLSSQQLELDGMACRRIEPTLEAAIMASTSFSDLAERFNQALVADLPGGGGKPVALKTILGYRGGLSIDQVSIDQAKANYDAVKTQFVDRGKRRIT